MTKKAKNSVIKRTRVKKALLNKKHPFPHDHFMKRILSKKRYCLDIFKLFLTKKQMALFDWSTLKTRLSSFIDKDGIERRMDLVVSVCRKDNNQRTTILFLIENKSHPDPLVLLKFLIYQIGMYYQQKIKDPVIPVLINQSQNKVWRGPVSFHEYLNNFDGELKACFKENVLGFKALVLNLQDEKVKKVAKGLTIEAAVYILVNIWGINESKLIKAFQLSKTLTKSDRKEMTGWIGDYIRQHDPSFTWKYIQEIEKKALKKEDRVMDTLFAEVKASAHQEGRQEGRQEVILNMLRENADIAFISKVTGLPAKEIKKFKNGSQAKS